MTRIVQIVPFIGPGTGVAGVAYNLERELRALGATVERFTFFDAQRRPEMRWPKSTILSRVHGGWRMIWFSTIGTRRAREYLATRPDAVTITHNNVMVGDVYVNHGLLLASMRARGRSFWGMYRNPVHVFIYLRDRIRYRGRTHRAVVCLSETDAASLRSTYGPVRPRIAVIPNGVDLEWFRPPTPEERLAARTELKLGTEERVAVFVGHEFSRKGLSFATGGSFTRRACCCSSSGATTTSSPSRTPRRRNSASAIASCSSAHAIIPCRSCTPPTSSCCPAPTKRTRSSCSRRSPPGCP